MRPARHARLEQRHQPVHDDAFHRERHQGAQQVAAALQLVAVHPGDAGASQHDRDPGAPRQAVTERPRTNWAVSTLLDLELRSGDWPQAEATLKRAEKLKVIESADAWQIPIGRLDRNAL